MGFSVKMGLQQLVFPEPPQDATEDYPQSCRVFQVVCLQKSPMGGRRRGADDRSSDRSPPQRTTDLLGLRPNAARLRPIAGAMLRIRALLGDCRALRVCDATGRVSNVRRESGASSLVRRQESTDHDLPLVSGRLGKAAFVERGRVCLRYDLAKRVSLGKTCRFLGPDPSQPGGHRGDRRGRNSMATGTQVPDAGIPDRRGLSPAAAAIACRWRLPRARCSIRASRSCSSCATKDKHYRSQIAQAEIE